MAERKVERKGGKRKKRDEARREKNETRRGERGKCWKKYEASVGKEANGVEISMQ